MSSAEEFNLRWNNHLNTISQLLGEFLNNKSLCDVTLSAEGQTISCHRVILAACSTYFQGIFNQVNDKSLVVMVKDAKFIDLKSLVDFMYYGEVSVEHDRLNSLLRTAESLKVKGLADEKKKEERILSEPPQMPVHVPQPAAVPQKRVMPPMPDSMSKRPRVSGAPSFAQSSRVSSASQPSPQVEGGLSQGSSDGVQPKQEVVELGDDGEDNGEQSYLDGDEKYDDGDSNLSGAGPSGMESGLDDSGQMEGVEGQDGGWKFRRPFPKPLPRSYNERRPIASRRAPLRRFRQQPLSDGAKSSPYHWVKSPLKASTPRQYAQHHPSTTTAGDTHSNRRSPPSPIDSSHSILSQSKSNITPQASGTPKPSSSPQPSSAPPAITITRHLAGSAAACSIPAEQAPMGSAESRYLTPFTRIRSGNRTRFFTPASLSATREQYLGTKGTKESDRFTSSNLDNRKFSADFSSVHDDSSGYIPLNLKETEQQPSTSVASGNSSSTRKSPGGTDMGRSESRSSSSGGEGSFRDIDERTKSLVFEYGDVQRSSEASRREPELMGDEFEQDSLKQGRANSLFETALRRVHSQSPRLNEQGDWEERSPVEEAESEEESEGRLKMVLDEEKQEEDAANNSDDEDSDFEGKEEKSRPAGPGDTPCFDSEAPPYDTYLAESFSKGTRTTYATPAASWNEEGQQNSNPLPPSCQEMVEQALSRLSGVTSTPASKSSTTLPIADRRGNRRGASGPSSAFVRYPRGPLNEDGSIECPDCGKVFTGRHRLVHIKEHKKKKKCIGGTQTGALRKKSQ